MAVGWMRIAGAIAWSACVVACVPKAEEPQNDSSTSGNDNGAGITSAAVTTGMVEGGESSSESGSAPACPAGDGATTTVMVEFPGNVGESEAGGVERDATCILVDSVAGPPTWQLLIACDETNGELMQPYTITAELPESPFEWATLNTPIELQYRRWWGNEVGVGDRLALVQDGIVQLVAYYESIDGGLSGVCATEDDTFRAQANDWLDKIDGRIEPAACDPPWTFRLARPADDGEAYAFPGDVATFDDGMSVLLEDARCAVEPNSGSEGWQLELVAWR